MNRNIRRGVLLLACVFGATLSTSAMAAEKIFAKIDGLYCGLCSGGLINQIRKSPGVKKATFFLQDGKVMLRPAAGARTMLNSVKSVIDASTYNFRGFELRGSGRFVKRGSGYVFVADGTGNEYRVDASGISAGNRAKLQKSGGKLVNVNGPLKSGSGGYTLRPSSIR